jgi:hypothetical protein
VPALLSVPFLSLGSEKCACGSDGFCIAPGIAVSRRAYTGTPASIYSWAGTNRAEPGQAIATHALITIRTENSD